MPITVCKNHSDKSLIELYKEMAKHDVQNPVWKKRSDAMIKLIHLINVSFKETQIWGLTSHERLVLLSENYWGSKWHVIISNIGDQSYYFEYSIPETKEPWPDATIRGMASSLQEAKKYLAIAMHESEAWTDNKELKELLEIVNV